MPQSWLPSDPRHRRALLAIIAAALAVRLLVFFALQPFPPLTKDDSVYDALGWNLLNGNGFSSSENAPFEPMAVRTPGYPSFLATVYAAAGRNANAVRLAQIGIVGLTMLIMFGLARRIGSGGTALAALGCYALLPSAIIFPSLLLTEANQALLLTVAIYCCYRILADPASSGWYVGLGFALGAATLQRPDYQLLIAPLVASLVLLAPNRRQVLPRAVLATACFVAVLAPWFARNCQVFDRCVGLATGSGHTAISAKFEAEGKYGAQLTEALRERYGDEFRRVYGREMTFIDGALPDQDAMRRRDFVAFVRNQPLVYARHSVHRMVLLWLPRSWTDTYGWKGDFKEASASSDHWLTAAKATMLMADAAFLGLGGLGLLFALPRWRTYLPLIVLFVYATAMYGLVYSSSRYRVPLLPLVAIFAGVGVTRLFSLIGARSHAAEKVPCVAS
jgi:hypothetical protein